MVPNMGPKFSLHGAKYQVPNSTVSLLCELMFLADEFPNIYSRW